MPERLAAGRAEDGPTAVAVHAASPSREIGGRRSWTSPNLGPELDPPSPGAPAGAGHTLRPAPLNAGPPGPPLLAFGAGSLLGPRVRSSDLLLPPLSMPAPQFAPPASLPNLSPRHTSSPVHANPQGTNSPPLFGAPHGRAARGAFTSSPSTSLRSVAAEPTPLPLGPPHAGEAPPLAPEVDALYVALNASERRCAALEHDLAEARAAAHVGRLLLDSAAPCLALDAAGRVALWSPAAERATGLPAAEALGRSFAEELTAAEGRERVRERLAAAAEGGGSVEVPAAVQAPARGGAPVEVRLAASRHGGGGGLPPGLFLVGLDSSAQQRAVHLLMGSVAHEMRTPLNHVLSALQLVALKPDLDPETGEYLRIAEGAAGHLLKVVNDLVEGARAEYGGGPPPKREPFDPRALVEEVASASAISAQAKGLELIVRVVEGSEEPADDSGSEAGASEEPDEGGYEARRSSAWEPPAAGGPLLRVPRRVLGDADRIRQCLINLVSNAIKCTSAGEVEITLQARGGGRGGEARPTLELAVRDTGLGIPAAERPKLFNLFSQTEATVERKIPGTGLGLAISQRLARRMGGGIAVESEAGRGSTFTLSVPLLELTADEEQRAIESERLGTLSRPASAATSRSDGPPSSSDAPPLAWSAATAAVVVEESAAGRAALAAALRARGLAVAARGSPAQCGPDLPPADVVFYCVPASPAPAAAAAGANADAVLAAALAAREAAPGPGGLLGTAACVVLCPYALLSDVRQRLAAAAARCGSCRTATPTGASQQARRLLGCFLLPKPPRAADLERALRDCALWLAEARSGPAKWPAALQGSEDLRRLAAMQSARSPGTPSDTPRVRSFGSFGPSSPLADGFQATFAPPAPPPPPPPPPPPLKSVTSSAASSFSSGPARHSPCNTTASERSSVEEPIAAGLADALRRAAGLRGEPPAPPPVAVAGLLAAPVRPVVAPSGERPVPPSAVVPYTPLNSPLRMSPAPPLRPLDHEEPDSPPRERGQPRSLPGAGRGGRSRAPSDAGDVLARPSLVPHGAATRADAPRILIADDNPINVKLLRRFLEREGYSVEAAATGTEAVAAFAAALPARPFDCLLLDLFMPGLGGCEVARRARELELAAGRPRTPILACTATSLPADLAAAAEAGMDDVLPKPVRSSRLYSALRRWVAPVAAASAPEPAPSLPPAPAPRSRARSTPDAHHSPTPPAT